jgi:hypothetical protein
MYQPELELACHGSLGILVSSLRPSSEGHWRSQGSQYPKGIRTAVIMDPEGKSEGGGAFLCTRLDDRGLCVVVHKLR